MFSRLFLLNILKFVSILKYSAVYFILKYILDRKIGNGLY